MSWSVHCLKYGCRQHKTDTIHRIVNQKTVIFVSNSGPDRLVGGVVSLIKPLAKRFKATWISASNGITNQPTHEDEGVVLRKVSISPQAYKSYYDDFCNGGLWTLCHDQNVEPLFREGDFNSYVAVNQLFASEVIRCAEDIAEPIIFINDYQLALLPKLLRSALPHAKILFYWHIPWPAYGRLTACPWRTELINGILGADNAGFQTNQDRDHFISAMPEGLDIEGATNLGVYPASIEWPALKNSQPGSMAESRAAIAKQYQLQASNYVYLSVDRVDCSKGIIERLHAIEKILNLNPALIKNIQFIQVYVQTRPLVLKSREYESQITELIARINHQYGSNDWQPIISERHTLTKEKLTYLYRSVNCLWVSSLADGQNLICKEFIASRDDDDGVLILSKHAGAAKELCDAVIYDPLNENDAIDAFNQTISMSDAERKNRMISLRQHVRSYDVHLWMDQQLLDLREEAPLAF
nr:trehalose-6-phosphate synthase [Polynucleobacter nymphae]